MKRERSKKPTTRRSGSRGKAHKPIVALKRAAKGKRATKLDKSGYGWPSDYASAMRRDESGKRSDEARARHFKAGRGKD